MRTEKKKHKKTQKHVIVAQEKYHHSVDDHKAKTCKHLNTKYRHCDNLGHLEKYVLGKQLDINSRKINYVIAEEDSSEFNKYYSYLLHF